MRWQPEFISQNAAVSLIIAPMSVVLIYPKTMGKIYLSKRYRYPLTPGKLVLAGILVLCVLVASNMDETRDEESSKSNPLGADLISQRSPKTTARGWGESPFGSIDTSQMALDTAMEDEHEVNEAIDKLLSNALKEEGQLIRELDVPLTPANLPTIGEQIVRQYHHCRADFGVNFLLFDTCPKIVSLMEKNARAPIEHMHKEGSAQATALLINIHAAELFHVEDGVVSNLTARQLQSLNALEQILREKPQLAPKNSDIFLTLFDQICTVEPFREICSHQALKSFHEFRDSAKINA
jgi:hypothetical protein